MYAQIFKLLKAPDYFSLAGLVLALISIFQGLKGNLAMAAVFIYLSTIADFLDGTVARKTKRDGNFGKILDSLCDVVLYLMAMVIFGYLAGLQSPVAIIVFVLFIVTGTMRLARFTIMGTVDDCYVGLPVSYTLAIPIAYFILAYLKVNLSFLLLFYFVISLLMISSIKVKKFQWVSRSMGG
jgi:CDP-diacylglycerol---serine O-phosphatidyltransferase